MARRIVVLDPSRELARAGGGVRERAPRRRRGQRRPRRRGAFRANRRCGSRARRSGARGRRARRARGAARSSRPRPALADRHRGGGGRHRAGPRGDEGGRQRFLGPLGEAQRASGHAAPQGEEVDPPRRREPRAHPRERGAAPRDGRALPHRRPQPASSRRPAPRPARGGGAASRPDPRRARDRQGAGRPRDPRRHRVAGRPLRGTVNCAALAPTPCSRASSSATSAGRSRAPTARAPRQVRAGRRRDALPRRDRPHVAAPSSRRSCASSSTGPSLRVGGTARGRGATRGPRGHQRRPAREDRARRVPAATSTTGSRSR